MVKKVMFFALFCMLFFVSFSSAAVGVTPAKYTENFKPGNSAEYEFTFFFEKERNVDFILEGQLKEYAQIIDTEHGFEYHKVKVRMDLPSSLETPGENRLIVTAFVPEKETSGGTISVKLSVSSSVRVFVPYPGKYASVELDVEDVNTGEDAPYTLTVKSLGSESLTVFPKLEVDLGGKVLDTISLETKTILSEESHTYSGFLDSKNFLAGNYNVTAYVDAGDGDLFESIDEFRLGELRVELTNYTKTVQQDKVNPVTLEFESFWNDPIDELYVNYRVKGTTDFEKSRSINLDPWQKNNIIVFLDTTGIDTDTVDLELEVNYGGRTDLETITLSLEKQTNWGFMLIVIAGIFGILIIIALLVLVIYLLRKQNEEKKSSKVK